MIERSVCELNANGTRHLMPKKVFIKALAAKIGTSQIVASQVIEALEETVLEGLVEYEKVKIGDLVAFTKKRIPERHYKLPNDDTDYLCEAYDKIVAHTTENNKKLKINMDAK